MHLKAAAVWSFSQWRPQIATTPVPICHKSRGVAGLLRRAGACCRHMLAMDSNPAHLLPPLRPLQSSSCLPQLWMSLRAKQSLPGDFLLMEEKPNKPLSGWAGRCTMSCGRPVSLESPAMCTQPERTHRLKSHSWSLGWAKTMFSEPKKSYNEDGLSPRDRGKA